MSSGGYVPFLSTPLACGFAVAWGLLCRGCAEKNPEAVPFKGCE